MSPLPALHATALRTDDRSDWRSFYQAFAGSTLIVPTTAEGGLDLDNVDGLPIARTWLSPEAFAEALSSPRSSAEVPGDLLAGTLADAGVPLEVMADEPIILDAQQLRWIADTYGADVQQTTNQGVEISAPAQPAPALVELLGQSVEALGASCQGAWLIEMAEPERPRELVLVLALAKEARAMETPIAETITRAVQPVADQPFAVACPDPDNKLFTRAQEIGIGIAHSG